MNGNSWSIEELRVWNRWGFLRERLAEGHVAPYNWRYEDEILSLEGLIENCRKEFPAEASCYVREVCAAAVLSGMACGDKPVASQLMMPVLYDQPASPDEIYRAKWAVTSWVMVFPGAEGSPKGRVCSALVGIGERDFSAEFPYWLERVCDRKAVKSVRTVVSLVKDCFGCGVFVRPLLPDKDSYQICGRSLGLAIFAGALAALRGINVAGKVCFSGVVERSGRCLAPGHVTMKAGIACDHGFRALVCGSSTRGGKTRIVSGLKTIPVAHVNDLEWLLVSYTPDGALEAETTVEIMSRPESMAYRIHKVDLKLLDSPMFSDRYANNVQKLLKSQDYVELFAKNLARLCAIHNNSPDVCRPLLKPFQPDFLEELMNVSPEAVWHIAMGGWACLNAGGDVCEAERWKSVASRALEKMASTPKRLECVADYENRAFVQYRHMCFHFSPDLPDGFARVLSVLESVYEALGCEVYETLGRMYGTVAQNYGFCGSDYLDLLEKYVRLAQKAFGDGRYPALRNDWRRELNYLVYGYLDAGRFDDAGKVLLSYLEISDLDRVEWRKLGQYEKAAFVRYIADTGYSWFDEEALVEEYLRSIRAVHPFQFVALNLGRVVKNRDIRRKAWKKSFEIAMSFKGPGRAMGFLPLACLCVEELADDDEILEGLRKICTTLRSIKGFNRYHFPGLFDERLLLDISTAKDFLTKIWAERSRFFPFTYR